MRLCGITQVNQDRVVRIDAEAKHRVGTLMCELTSRHANLFWLKEGDIIVGSFHVNRSHKRQLVPGCPYIPPLPRPPSQAEAMVRFRDTPHLERDIETHYDQKETALIENQERALARRLIHRAMRRVDRLLVKLDADYARASQGDHLAHLGHLLKANLHQATKGVERLEVVDFEGKQAVIPLDPLLGPVPNMERLFAKSRRLRKALPIIAHRRAETTAKKETLTALADRIGTLPATDLEEALAEVAKWFPEFKRQMGKRHEKNAERLPYREVAISAGRIARVGRSAKDNDALTLRFAKPDDLWLHVRGRSGSHVVVPMGRGEDPLPDLLVDAAHLAAHFSSAKNDPDVEVVHTRRRYVQKPRGAPPGAVRLLKEKTLLLRIEPERLQRLLKGAP